MPELPEVEVVRAGLANRVADRTIRQVEVRHPRAVRRHVDGATDFAERLVDRTIGCVSRRGKYLWFVLASDDASSDRALVCHLGMSGQLLLVPPEQTDGPHLRIRIGLDSDERELRFVDQRTFGGMVVDNLTADDANGHVPVSIAHIARDVLDPGLDERGVVRRIRSKDVEIKRILLDQTTISGIGNIYADEALWRAGIHGARRGRTLSVATVGALLADLRAVMGEALAVGGTSFDALYVDVDGNRGYFERELAVYGRRDEPCRRCGTPIRRSAFMNRSSFWCPRCQRAPRR